MVDSADLTQLKLSENESIIFDCWQARYYDLGMNNEKYSKASFGCLGLLKSFLGKINQLEGYRRSANIIYKMIDLNEFEVEIIGNQLNNYLYVDGLRI